MNKNLKEFGKYASLILCAIFIEKSIDKYIIFDWSNWILAIVFAFIFFMCAKSID